MKMEAVRTLKRGSTPTRLHGVISQKALIPTLAAVRTPNLTYYKFPSLLNKCRLRHVPIKSFLVH
jgi:hypothetical protein